MGESTMRYVRLKKKPAVLPCQIGHVTVGSFPCHVEIDASRLEFQLKNFGHWFEECDVNGKRDDDPVEPEVPAEPVAPETEQPAALEEQVAPEAAEAVAEAAESEPDEAPESDSIEEAKAKGAEPNTSRAGKRSTRKKKE